MHEMSLVNNMLKILEREIDSPEIKEIKKIHLEVGQMQYIIPDLMQTAFNASEKSEKLKDAELLESRMNNLGTVEAYIGTFFSKEYVMKKVLRMTDNEIENMQDQIKKETGMDPEDGGVDVPQTTDGITRYPSQDGNPISPDDVAKYDGQEVEDEEK